MYDPLRRKNVPDTPEEFVRQWFIKWLIDDKGYSVLRMSSEYSFSYNRLSYRADIVVFGKQLEPLLLVECKAPSVKIDKSVVEQGLRYNRVLSVKFMIFTNGNSHYLCKRNKDTGFFESVKEVPSYQELLDS